MEWLRHAPSPPSPRQSPRCRPVFEPQVFGADVHGLFVLPWIRRGRFFSLHWAKGRPLHIPPRCFLPLVLWLQLSFGNARLLAWFSFWSNMCRRPSLLFVLGLLLVLFGARVLLAAQVGPFPPGCAGGPFSFPRNLVLLIFHLPRQIVFQAERRRSFGGEPLCEAGCLHVAGLTCFLQLFLPLCLSIVSRAVMST